MEAPKSGLLPALFSALLMPLVGFLDRPSLPRYQGTITLRGLRREVEVCWDGHGVPAILGADEHDLFFAQGFLHAQERLWQMDVSRRFLSGEMAEVFGDFRLPWRELTSQFRGQTSADFDYFMRLIGICSAARAELAISDESDWGRLEAYSEGVNRYIETCGKKLPWEFRALRYEAAPWRPEDCLTIGKGLAFFVSPALFTRLNMLALAARLDARSFKLRSLMPHYPDNGPMVTRARWHTASGVWQFLSGIWANDWGAAGHGSNAWVIAPQRSASGGAILCNDPHLRLTLPSIWYLMLLRAEPNHAQPDGADVWGASVPGCPGIQIGRNRRIAWGATASLCDDVELYWEKLHRFDPDCYLAGYQWRRTERRLETIRIRGKGTIDRLVRLTRHGPVLSDIHGGMSAAEVLAFRWTAQVPSREFHAFWMINQARNWQEFLTALTYHGAPALNFVYADREGNIGYSLAGLIPARREAPSLLPLEGWHDSDDWQGYIPFDELPRLYNPPEGIVAVANNRIVDGSFPYHLSHFFEPPYRIARIESLLRAKPKFSLGDVAQMQMDVVSLHARDLIEALASDIEPSARRDGNISAAARRLLGWDGSSQAGSVEAAIFQVFYQKLTANLLTPVLGEDLYPTVVEIFNQSLAPVARILKDPNSEWFESVSRAQLVGRSLNEAVGELIEVLGPDMERWHWGRIHTLALTHNLGRLSLLRETLSVGPFPAPGDGTTINMGFYRHSAPYRQIVGATLRFIADLGAGGHSRFIQSSGQSGHLRSPHYSDQTLLWRSGQMIEVETADTKVDDERRLHLQPQ